MAERINAPRVGFEDAGLVGHLRSFFSAAAVYSRARLQLLALESKEATAHYVLIVLLLAGALIGLFFGYLFFWVAVVFLLSMATGIAWAWFMLGAALLHLGAAFTAALVAKDRFADPMFTATINEFRKDHQWLTSPPTPASSPN